MNRNEQRKLNAIADKIFVLIPEYKAVNNSAYIHLKEIYEGLCKVSDPGQVETQNGNTVSISAVREKLLFISAQYGNPEIDLKVEIVFNSSVSLTAEIKKLYKPSDLAKNEYWSKEEWIHGSANSLDNFFADCEAFLKEHYAAYKAHSDSNPEVVIDSPATETAQHE